MLQNIRISDSEEQIRHDMIELLSSGKSVLFMGAGYSADMKNMYGECLPTANKLAEEICTLGNFTKSSDLSYATSRYLDDPNLNRLQLIELLKNKLTVKETNKDHEVIARVNWRRCYTTNYDDGFKQAALKNNKIVTTVELDDSVQSFYQANNNLCVHINGKLDSLSSHSLDNQFKMSSESYLVKDDFLESEWFKLFKLDLEQASAIIFVGYSLFDEFIKKILFWNNGAFKDKTFFIIKNDASEEMIFKLKKFGRILKISVSGLANILEDNIEVINSDMEIDESTLLSLELYEDKYKEGDFSLSDEEIEDLFINGNIEQENIDAFIKGEIRKDIRFNSLIYRKDLIDKIRSSIVCNKDVSIIGDLGNGKTLLMNMLKSVISSESINVYSLKDDAKLDDFIKDLDYLSKRNSRFILFIEGILINKDILEYFYLLNPLNINIIASERTMDYEFNKSLLKEHLKFNVDMLNKEEISQLVKLIDNLAAWKDEQLGLKDIDKVEYISKQCDSKLSSVLLGVLDSKNIKNKLKFSIEPLLSNNDTKKLVFAISFLAINSYSSSDRVSNSMISDVLGNFSVYQSDIVNSKEFKSLFSFNSNGAEVKSTLFCLSLIRNFFDSSFIASELLNISVSLEKLRGKDFNRHVYDELFKTTLRFSTVERIFPDKNKKVMLRTYYDSLKKRIPWLENHPHYWLQYAMCYIALKEYDKAQALLKNAYEKANIKNNYDSKKLILNKLGYIY